MAFPSCRLLRLPFVQRLRLQGVGPTESPLPRGGFTRLTPPDPLLTFIPSEDLSPPASPAEASSSPGLSHAADQPKPTVVMNALQSFKEPEDGLVSFETTVPSEVAVVG